jgi:arginyl-tRNA synthetase
MTSSSAADADAGAWDPWAPIKAHAAREIARRLSDRGRAESTDSILRQLDEAPVGLADLGLALHRPAKALGTSPQALATELATDFPLASGLERVTAAGPYLNFHADMAALVRATLDLVFGRADRYGEGLRRPETVCVEHTSANTTGPLHVGRVRNAIIGDTLARLLRAAGHPVTTQYYVDDMGRQAALITWIWMKPVDGWPPEIRSAMGPYAGEAAPEAPNEEKPDHFYGRPYPAASAYVKEHPEAAAEVAELAHRIEAGRPPAEHRRYGELILGGMLESLRRLGIDFDEFVWESSLLADGAVEKVVDRLAHAPHASREENGALAIDGAAYGLPREGARIMITRRDGTTLYQTRDIAYHLQKFARFARVIDVLGQDHLLHARTIEAMLNEIGEPRRPEFVLYQYINAPSGGKMSTRLGTAVYLDDLYSDAIERARQEVVSRREDLPREEVDAIARRVASGAIRYNIVRVAPDKPVQFRWEEALAFDGRSGPFLQYSYARASSILRKAERERPPYPFRPESLEAPDERAVVRSIARLPSVVAYAARTAHVHALATYAHELAERFNRFYQSLPVLRAEGELRESRIALVAATRQTLGNCLGFLGIERLERM